MNVIKTKQYEALKGHRTEEVRGNVCVCGGGFIFCGGAFGIAVLYL